jgi:hypothetical protein
MRERVYGCLRERMSEVTQPDSIGSMKLYDTLSFETAHGLVDVLRVAPGWALISP